MCNVLWLRAKRQDTSLKYSSQYKAVLISTAHYMYGHTEAASYVQYKNTTIGKSCMQV